MGATSQRRLLTTSGDSLTLALSGSSRLGAGGQGQVFRSRLGQQVVAVKLLRQPDAARLQALQALAPHCAALTTLPQQLLYADDNGRCGPLVGYAMRCLEPLQCLSAARLFNFDELQRLRRFTWRDAVLAAMRLAESLAVLQRHAVVVGDLNPENVLFERQSDGAGRSTWRAVLLDSDSFQISGPGGERHHCPVARAPYTAPELIGCDLSSTWRQPASDHFALAVLIYQLLLHDHPYDNAIQDGEPDLDVSAKIRRGCYPHASQPPAGCRPGPWRPAPAEISAALDSAFRRSFAADPSQRPSAEDWVALLKGLHRDLVPCQRTAGHHHPRALPCPWCAVEARIGQPLCRFPHGDPEPSATAASSVEPPQPTPGLEPRLLNHGQRLQDVRQLHTTLQERLQKLERQLNDLAARHSAQQRHDQQALESAMNSMRCRLSRWLGRSDNQIQRESLRDQLQQRLIAAAGSDAIDGLRRRRARLHDELSSRCSSALTQLPPAAEAKTAAQDRLRQAPLQASQRWLRRQLEQDSLRSWHVEGFGPTRLALLESHGIVHAEHLRAHIDRLTALPGIGIRLQQRLRDQLQTVLQRLQSEPAFRAPAITWHDVVPPMEEAALEQLDSALQAAKQQLIALEQALHNQQETLKNQQSERQQQLAQLKALC